MKKSTLVFLVQLFLLSIAYGQKGLKTNLEKATHYLNIKDEVCFNFTAKTEQQVIELSKVLSYGHKTIDRSNLTVEAYANKTTFNTFLSYNLPFTVNKEDNELSFNPHEAGLSTQARSSNIMAAWDTTWDAYPRYSEYTAKMQYFANTYPNLCTLQSIGTTVSGRELWVLKISDNVNTNEEEPEFFYTSTMHGDELAGFPLMIRLIDYLLNNYGTDPEVTNLVDNLEIYINPNANPDGSYRLGDTDAITSPRRANDNNQDLNRNYPDNVAGLHYDGIYEDETLAFINFAKSKNFVLSANFHGGTELVNYPYDNAYVSEYTHADGDYYEYISVEYATNAQNNSPSGYMVDDEDSNVYPSPGVTHGAEWYRVYGGRQDFMNYYHQDKEVTIELSDVKWVSGANLPALWNYNRQALLDFMKQATYGLQGTITDQSGNPIRAKIEISGHDRLNTFRLSNADLGDYQKLLKAGNYNVTYSAPGYIAQTIPVTISDNNKTIQNVVLTATTANPTGNNQSICDSGSITLTANGSGTLNWYETENSSTPIATGNSYTTPVLSTTTSYYVEDVISKSNVGNQDYNSNGANHTTSGRYLIFNCTESVLLEQVTVNAANAGEIEIELQDETTKVLNSAIVFVNAGLNTVDLNFEIPVANNLRLVGKNFSTGGLYRNNANVNFPYTNGSISIIDSNAGTSYYYFFYDWKIGNIKSARAQIDAIVNPSPIANFTSDINNLNNGEVTFNNTSNNATSYLWDFGDGNSSTDQNPVHTYMTSGEYTVTLTSTNPNCGNNQKSETINVTISTLGLADVDVLDFKIYPNPFKSSITIQSETSNTLNIKLFDINGRLLISKEKITPINNKIELNYLETLQNGTYFMSIEDLISKTKSIKKLIK
ncbi:M14 family zinc carboxypeptidase [Mesoflavibacter profundi]|nr:M14 family zinc carboxypeptidase [Mesoflavibacter profundi]